MSRSPSSPPPRDPGEEPARKPAAKPVLDDGKKKASRERATNDTNTPPGPERTSEDRSSQTNQPSARSYETDQPPDTSPDRASAQANPEP